MKICSECEKFYIEHATEPYSELTPGEDFEMGCLDNIWRFTEFGTIEEFADKIKTAQNCKLFKERKIENEPGRFKNRL